MGAIGVAILAFNHIVSTKSNSIFGHGYCCSKLQVKSFECKGCPNNCEIIQLFSDNKLKARWGRQVWKMVFNHRCLKVKIYEIQHRICKIKVKIVQVIAYNFPSFNLVTKPRAPYNMA